LAGWIILRRTSKARGLLFYRLLQQSVMVAPASYKEIIGKQLPNMGAY